MKILVRIILLPVCYVFAWISYDAAAEPPATFSFIPDLAVRLGVSLDVLSFLTGGISVAAFTVVMFSFTQKSQ
ncbi:MAG: hypothetical protein AAGF24_13515 [Cyanobacteria bacterium P01_H01_bin.121]